MNATFHTSPHTSVPGAFGYTISLPAGVYMRQGFKPGCSGKVRMTEAEAISCGQAVCDELQAATPAVAVAVAV